MGICGSSLINQKYNEGWIQLKMFVDLFRVFYLHINGRNHFNVLLFNNMQKAKTCLAVRWAVKYQYNFLKFVL